MSAVHGGDVWGKGHILDFSASLNPLGMAEEVRRAALLGVEQSVHYPDPACAALTRALCAALSIHPSQVSWGNGAADLLEGAVAALRPEKALLFVPCFGEYERVLRQFGCEVQDCVLRAEESFDLGEAHLKALTPELDLVILCTPNNPTGRCISPALLRSVLERCADLDIAVLADESFLELSDPEQRVDLLPYLKDGRRLLLLRSMTKSHCIPGLRLGYALCGHRGWKSALDRWGDPWRVSVPAQLAGAAALQRSDWPERARALLRPERERLTGALRGLGCTVWDSHANFLLFRVDGVSDLRERVLERGLLIRHCADFRALGPDYYRVAVRTEEENARLLAALQEVL